MSVEDKSDRLSVVKLEDDSYRVSGVIQDGEVTVRGVTGIISEMGGYSPAVLKAEPTYEGLSTDTQTVIDAVRSVLIRRDKAWQGKVTEVQTSLDRLANLATQLFP